MITTSDVLDYLVADEQTKVICLFLEEIGDPAAFSAATLRADQAGKPIVALKVGVSEAGQQSALAHTGAVAGDDAVVDAVLRQLNIIRVASIEELLTTASVLGYQRVPRGRRMGVLTASGGACDIIADRASAAGLEIPPFTPETTEVIAAHLPSFAAARNPLDVTGYVLANARTSPLTAIDHALDAALADPGLDFVIFTGFTVPETRPAGHPAGGTAGVADRLARGPDRSGADPGDPAEPDLRGHRRLPERAARRPRRAPGQRDGAGCAGHRQRAALAGRARPRPGAARPRGHQRAGTATAWPEARARDLAAGAGIPVVPGGWPGPRPRPSVPPPPWAAPVALKISSARITHKSDIGGVALGLSTDEEIRAAYDRVTRERRWRWRRRRRGARDRDADRRHRGARWRQRRSGLRPGAGRRPRRRLRGDPHAMSACGCCPSTRPRSAACWPSCAGCRC